MNLLRRTLLKGVGASGVLLAALASGMLKPRGAEAAEWNRNAFEAKEIAAALQAIGAAGAVESGDLLLNAPEIAENGALVPVEIVSLIPDTTSLAVLVEKNPVPLAGHFDFANGALPEISLRLKLAQTSNVKVIAKADGKSYSRQREIKVTTGGCDE